MSVSDPFVVEPMTLADLDQVMAIEQLSFSAPWSRRAYEYEITQNEHSTMLVARATPLLKGRMLWLLHRLGISRRGSALGYAGAWLLVDEIHLSTIAVHPQWRGWGLGELLLIAVLERGAQQGARRATLEVRVSNSAAQGLYHKYGFETVASQRRYYADNNEDAYIMTTPRFETFEFQANLRRCRDDLLARLRTLGMNMQPRQFEQDSVPGKQAS
jgi:ribosomal-protein-alanine N-acetyltransferase